MSPPQPESVSKRLRFGATVALLLFAAGLILFLARSANQTRTAAAPQETAPSVTPPPPPEPSNAGLAELKRQMREAIANDGRRMDPHTVLPATASSHHKLELALDELAAINPGRGLVCYPVSGVTNRAALDSEIRRQSEAARRSVFPVFYVKGAPHVPGTRRILTGEMLGALSPGVSTEEIAREYKLKVVAPQDPRDFMRFFASSALGAVDVFARLARDARVAFIDHAPIYFVQPKAFIPDDTYFVDQWYLLDTVPGRVAFWDLHLFPNPEDPLGTPPVWGDFAIPLDGVRGREVRIGLVDDGIEVSHADIAGNLATLFDHYAFELEATQPTSQSPNPPPHVVSSNGTAVNHQEYFNEGHGTHVAGLIAAVGNNRQGVIGVAPESKLVGIRALGYYEDLFGTLIPVSRINDRPEEDPQLSPSSDVLLSAALMHLFNTDSGYTFNGQYPTSGEPLDVRPFGYGAFGPTIQIKNCSWGAPDVAIFAGPGPEIAGVPLGIPGVIPKPGVRKRSVLEGRGGLGTIFVNAAGNGRRQMENANADGWGNAREVICVGGLALPEIQDYARIDADYNSTFSEWGSCVLVTAPSGGPYFWQKMPPQRQYNGLSTTGQIRGGPSTPTTDWSINKQAGTMGNPPFEPLFGRNNGGGTTDYTSAAYTRNYGGTSASAAMVSGIVALMLEANPRLSWLDVQHMLIRSAHNHLVRPAYLLDPTNPNPLRNEIFGLDPRDPEDFIVIDRDWKKNGGHIWFNHKYGAGFADAINAVALARLGTLLPPQIEHLSFEQANLTRKELPDAPASNPPYEIDFGFGEIPDFVITHVTVRVDRIATTAAGDIYMTVLSPSGMESILAEPFIYRGEDISNWTFNTLRHWGEGTAFNGNSTWKLRIADNVPADRATVNPDEGDKITMTLHGYTRPAIPLITDPESTVITEPTPVVLVEDSSVSYTMAALNNPTTWFTIGTTLADPPNGLPPGLRLAPITAHPSNTYLPTRSVVGTPTLPGTYHATVFAENVGGRSVPHYVRFIVIPEDDCYVQWGDAHFIVGGAESDDADQNEDIDGDGLTNVSEFALGTNPNVPDAAGAVRFAKNEAGNWTLTYKRMIEHLGDGDGDGDIEAHTYEVESTNDLRTWTAVSRSGPDPGPTVSLDPLLYEVSEGEIVDSPEVCGDYVPVTVTFLASPPAEFYRVKITPYRDPLDPYP